jgi:hypothetical protein
MVVVLTTKLVQARERAKELEAALLFLKEKGVDIQQQEEMLKIQAENLELRQWKERALRHIENPREPHPDDKDAKSLFQQQLDALNATLEPPSGND